MSFFNPKSMMDNISSTVSSTGGNVFSSISQVKDKVQAGVSQGVSSVSGAIPTQIPFPKIPGTGGVGDGNVTYDTFRAKHAPEVLKLLLDHFRIDEPTNAAVGLEDEDAIYAFIDWVSSSIRDKVSFVAVDLSTNKVVAARLNTMQLREKQGAPRPRYPPRMMKITNFIEVLAKDVFRTLPGSQPGHPASKVLKLEIVIVDPAYRRRGIAHALLQASIELAVRDRYEWVYATATSHKTQALFEKMGFKALRTVNYADYTDPETGERPFATNMQPEDTCGKLMVRKPEAAPPAPGAPGGAPPGGHLQGQQGGHPPQQQQHGGHPQGGGGHPQMQHHQQQQPHH